MVNKYWEVDARNWKGKGEKVLMSLCSLGVSANWLSLEGG